MGAHNLCDVHLDRTADVCHGGVHQCFVVNDLRQICVWVWLDKIEYLYWICSSLAIPYSIFLILGWELNR